MCRPVRSSWVAGLFLAGITGCSGSSAELSECRATPQDEGEAVFGAANGRRVAGSDMEMTFQLGLSNGERYTSTPDVRSDLGRLVDAETRGQTLRIVLRPYGSGEQSGSVTLAGSISGDFQDGVDRCPFEHTFNVHAGNSLITIR